MTSKIDENAAGGSVGAGSIAVNPSAGFGHNDQPSDNKVKKVKMNKRDSFVNFYKIVTHEDLNETDRTAELEWREDIKNKKDKKEDEKYAKMREQIAKAKEIKSKKNKRSFSSFFKKSVNEEVDLHNVVANLKGVERANSDNLKDTATSYGIEDDKGNFMRVTVPSGDAKEFEIAIARKMADNENNPLNNLNNRKQSLAEILFDLQKQFNILDVEFPIIPKNAVYNKNEASNALPAQPQLDNQLNTPNDMNPDENMDDLGLDNNAPEDESGLPPEEDADNVEDFGQEFSDENNPASLLSSLVDMLKKQAEAETAKANAAAEQARATQAEWSAIASNKEVERQEELARVQADLEEKKRREKMAKQYADLAKYNVEQGKSSLNKMDVGESMSFLYDSLLEDVDVDNIPALQQQKQIIERKYASQPQDTNLDKNYKMAAMRLEMAQLNSKIELIKLSKQYETQKAKSTTQNNQQNPQQPNQNTQQTTQPQQTNTQPQANNVQVQGQPQGQQ